MVAVTRTLKILIMEKISLSPERWRQIALANFDRYVKQRLIETSYVVTDDGIDERNLCCLADEAKCNVDNLQKTISNSLNRINKNHLPTTILETDENDVMIALAKLHIKEYAGSMLNHKREFGRILKELNHYNFGLHVSTDEFISFIKPLYLAAIEEVLIF